MNNSFQSDILLIYAVDDLDKAAKMTVDFKEHNWRVWRGSYSPASKMDFSKNTANRAIESTKVIVITWSRAARNTLFIREALKHVGRIPLFFVLLEKVELPVEVMLTPLQHFDLSDWDGSESHFGRQTLLSHLHTLIPTATSLAASPASIEELSLSKIRENASLGIKEGANSVAEGRTRFGGVFISYRRNEAEMYAGRLYDRLVERFGKEKVFIDTENIEEGDDFVDAITTAAESCAVMLVLIGQQWVRGKETQEVSPDYIQLEVVTALKRKIHVRPILIQGALMPNTRELHEDLAPLVRLNASTLSSGSRWGRDVEDLIKSLENLL